MRAVSVEIDRVSPVPLYHQLAEQLTTAITSGELQPGDAFENELDLAERLGLSRPTVRRAVQELVNKGLLVRRRGVGTHVARQVVHRKVDLTSLFDDLQHAGREPHSDLLSFERDVVDAGMAARLGLDAATPLVRLRRLRYAGSDPLAILENWLPPSLADLDQAGLTTNGLYALLRERNVRPAVAKQTIGARMPSVQERRLLDIDRSVPLVTVLREAYDATGVAIEVGVHCYRADEYTAEVMLYDR